MHIERVVAQRRGPDPSRKNEQGKQGGSLQYFMMAPAEREPTTYRMRGGHANHKAIPTWSCNFDLELILIFFNYSLITNIYLSQTS